jgi:hypothetical protein
VEGRVDTSTPTEPEKSSYLHSLLIQVGKEEAGVQAMEDTAGLITHHQHPTSFLRIL